MSYVVSMLMLGAIAHLYFRREKIGRTLYLLISVAIAVAILSGFTNFVGHILEIISKYLISWGSILHGLETPYDTIFTELKASATTDSLTGLYNRQGFIEATKKEMTKAGTEGYTLSLFLIFLACWTRRIRKCTRKKGKRRVLALNFRGI